MGSASLRLKFAVLFCGIVAIVLTGSLAWVSFVQQQQAEREMLETTQVLARQMDAVWDFMELNQEEFITDEDGEQTLYCVVAAKAVSRIFTENSDYVIHYTNTTTRKKHDSPDAFEAKALEVLKGDPSREYYYGIEEVAGMGEAFRYVEPLFITDSCLECHGAPQRRHRFQGVPQGGPSSRRYSWSGEHFDADKHLRGQCFRHGGSAADCIPALVDWRYLRHLLCGLEACHASAGQLGCCGARGRRGGTSTSTLME